MGLELAITIGGQVVFGILAWLVSRAINAIDQDLEHVRISLCEIRDKLYSESTKIAVIESRIRERPRRD